MKNSKENILTNSYVIMLLALIACFLWGSAFPSIKIGYKLFEINKTNTYGKILFAGYRFLLSSMLILIFCTISKLSIKIKKEAFFKLILLGVIQTFLQYIFFYIGLSNTSGVKGAIISSSNTFFSVLLPHFFYREDKITYKRLIGVILGFIGVVIVNLKAGSFDGGFKFTGEGFIILSSLAGAFAGIYTKKLAKDISPFAVSGYQLFTGSIALILVGTLGASQNITFTTKGSILLLYMAFISAAAFSIWAVLLKYNGVGKVSIYKFSIPIIGSFLSFFLLNESFKSSNVIFAIILVSLGIYLINKK
ncbi:DMT family transporter [Haloimpatiens sp. FM7315]|uniref:DMT family transporter n=1 Tax=Haloimpatiens sp. FM7315 TaxID=3298609 RepID=UPI00370A236A